MKNIRKKRRQTDKKFLPKAVPRAAADLVRQLKTDTYYILNLFLGPKMPEARVDLSAVNIGKSLVILGGRNDRKTDGKAIYKITCSMGICKWTTLPQRLSISRSGMVAIAIPDSLANCE